MPIPKRVAGTLTPPGVDTLVSVTRQSGASKSKFEAIKPLYFSFSIDPALIVTAILPYSFKAQFSFPGSQEKWRWYLAFDLQGGLGGAPYETHKELYVPPGTPLLYEEEFTVSMVSVGTGLVIPVDYVFYFDIVATTELQMVQEMSRYV